MCPGIGASIKNSLLRYKNRPCRERKHRSGGEKQKGSRGIRRGQGYRLVFQFPIRQDGLGNKNIDIAFITDKNHKKHLSDIFKVINESGVKYDVIHFGACRVNREEK
ncbi:putative adhesin [Escherichia coli]